MKQHLRFLFTLLLAIVCGGAMFGQTTVTDELTPGSWDITGQNNYSQKKQLLYLLVYLIVVIFSLIKMET